MDLGPSSPLESGLSTRVSVKALGRLHSSVDDLIAARNGLLATMKAVAAPELSAPVARLMSVARDLNASLLSARGQPAERLFSALRRRVAELSARLGKKARLNVQGGCLELDGQWLDAMREPLLGLVGAALAEGVESPRERRLAGKEETGTLEAIVRLEAGAALITISHDGRHRGAGEAEPIDAARDAVRAARERIELLGGSLSWAARPSGGMIAVVRVPLNLSMATAFTVFVGDQRFAVRSSCVDEVVALGGDGVRELCERDDRSILRTSAGLFPSVDLRDILRIDVRDVRQQRERRVALRMSAGPRSFAVIADDVGEAREIVLKPLPKSLRRSSVFAGAAILEDGAVALELDAAGLAAALGVARGPSESDVRQDAPRAKLPPPRNLVFRAHGDSKVLPLTSLTRVVKLLANDVEFGAHGAELRVEGGRVPLVRIDGGRVISISSAANALLIARDDLRLALLVDAIEGLEDDQNQEGAGVVIDTFPLFDRHGSSFDAPTRNGEGAVLVLEPMPLFGELVASSLSAAGYVPVVVRDAAELIAALATTPRSRAVLLDLDAPEVRDGSLARELRASDPMATLIGLASHAGPAARNRAAAAGLTSVVGKFDREALSVMLSTSIHSADGGIAA